MITKKKLEKFNKEELIQLCLLRNDDAKDYSKTLANNNLKHIIKIVEMALDKRNTEVKQAIEVTIPDCWEDKKTKIVLKQIKKELLQKLGLDN